MFCKRARGAFALLFFIDFFLDLLRKCICSKELRV